MALSQNGRTIAGRDSQRQARLAARRLRCRPWHWSQQASTHRRTSRYIRVSFRSACVAGCQGAEGWFFAVIKQVFFRVDRSKLEAHEVLAPDQLALIDFADVRNH